MMNLAQYVSASLRQYRRAHLPVMLGVAVATAVLTGALLVGDSVRGSLRDLTLQRLGSIDQAVVAQQPFRAALAEELAAAPGFQQTFAGADAAFLLRGSLSARTDGGKRFAGGVQVVGVSPNFAQHGDAPWVADLTGDAVAITAPVARDLGVGEGDEIVLRLPTLDALPADSPLGEKIDTTVGKRLKIASVLPTKGLARFSLSPAQTAPRNAFVPLATLQQALGLEGKANALLVDYRKAGQGSPPEQDQRLSEMIQPHFEDLGLTATALPSGAVQIESSQLVLPEQVVEPGLTAFAEAQPVVTYLANTIRVGEASIPYSTVAGVNSTTAGPLVNEAGEPITLSDNEVVLNDWAAAQLGATIGDTVTVTYYEPESTHGELVEAPLLELKLVAIAPLQNADGDATLAADPRLTPELEGVTDADSINDWDLPFELVEPITPADEDYWDQHSTTPKAFVSLALARRLWATRWGEISLLRIASDDVQQVERDLLDALNPADLGFAFLPVKRQGLQASSGTTPFDGLFFGFSMFLIASSVMLIALLFGLGVENRAREVGLLAAVGWGPKRIGAALTREGLWVALAGVAIGVPAGIAYAAAMIWGLTTLWVEAIVSPFLRLHVTTTSLAIGAVIGVLVAWLTVRFVVRRLLGAPARGLLAGQLPDAASGPRRLGRWPQLVLLALAIGLPIAAALSGATAEAQAGMFFGGGAALLASLLLFVRTTLARRDIRLAAPTPFDVAALARRDVARNPGRSVLTLALVGSASFLILAISAFRLDPTEEGTGGFVLVGRSDQPVHYDLNTPKGRLELAFSQRDEDQLDQFQVHALRLHDGEDASCLNLYQTRQPRVLGLPEEFLERGGFAFAATAIDRRFKGAEAETWRALAPSPQPPDPTQPLPVILDFNTAMYSMKLYGGVGSRLTIRDSADQPVELEVVGMLKNSLLQGDLLMSEQNFLRLFPDESGSRFFLVEATGNSPADADALAVMLEDRLSDYGMDLERADRRLAGFLAVQNTYLSTFQSLGALGLLLGAVGVAVVQLRNLVERRGELALLRAGGFAPARLQGLVFRENLTLLGGGLAIGAVAAAVALAPQVVSAAQDARLPWATVAGLLGAILVIGLVVGRLATRGAVRAPIIPALRGE